MNWRKWLSAGLAAALVLSLSTVDLAQAGEEQQTAEAYLYFTDGWWQTNYHPGEGNSDSAIQAEWADITGDGEYHVSLDFTETASGHSNTAANAKICIRDGETVFGSRSTIKIKSVTVNGNSLPIAHEGYTGGAANGTDTILYLFTTQDMRYEIASDREEGAERTLEDLNPIPGLGDANIETLDVVFEFTANAAPDPDSTPNPNATTSPDLNNTPDPDSTSDPDATSTIDPNSTPDPDATTSPDPDTTPDPNSTPEPDATAEPGTAQNGQNSIVSNSTYTGPEKILLQKNAVTVAAGKSTSITFALLRSAASKTPVTVSSANAGIAVPVLQSNGTVNIRVPAAAAPGSSTAVSLRFGSSTAVVKVTVDNPVTRMKAAKKSYKVKRGKKVKAVFKVTKKNKSGAATQAATAKIAGKKASVSSVKLSGSKLTVKVKGLKKGNATLKVSMGGKTAKTKIKVK